VPTMNEPSSGLPTAPGNVRPRVAAARSRRGTLLYRLRVLACCLPLAGALLSGCTQPPADFHLWVANSYSCSNWSLKKSVAV
jgi:hypothetical protein